MAKGRYASVEKKDCIACGTCMIVCPRDAVTIKTNYVKSSDFCKKSQ